MIKFVKRLSITSALSISLVISPTFASGPEANTNAQQSQQMQQMQQLQQKMQKDMETMRADQLKLQQQRQQLEKDRMELMQLKQKMMNERAGNRPNQMQQTAPTANSAPQTTQPSN
jgi:hypothetical protein